VLERFPFALPMVREVIDACGGDRLRERDAAQIESFRVAFRGELKRAAATIDPGEAGEPTPGITPSKRLDAARQELLSACDDFLAREAIAASLTRDERREILRGMILTRAVDNQLKQFFTGSEITYEGKPFQGKGFRSLGQEAI